MSEEAEGFQADPSHVRGIAELAADCLWSEAFDVLLHPTRMATVTDFPHVRSTERAVCELCGGVIATTNGGLYTGLRFIPFERLLDLHMAERHSDVCVLPTAREHKMAA